MSLVHGPKPELAINFKSHFMYIVSSYEKYSSRTIAELRQLSDRIGGTTDASSPDRAEFHSKMTHLIDQLMEIHPIL